MPQSVQTQIVPYNPAQVAQMYPHLGAVAQAPQEKKPLTPNELQRLYSLNSGPPSYSVAAAPPQWPSLNTYGNQSFSPSIYPQFTPPIIGPIQAPKVHLIPFLSKKINNSECFQFFIDNDLVKFIEPKNPTVTWLKIYLFASL